MSRTWKRLLAVVVAVPAIGALHTSAALAGDAGRNCRTYYYHADQSSGWGFTVCVKVEHDPTAHTWQAVGSVTTTTPGMTLNRAQATIFLSQGNTIFQQPGPLTGPAVSQILGITSGPLQCTGTAGLVGELDEAVKWPSGELSSKTSTFTIGDNGREGFSLAGTC